jgi:hypothetical protein
VTPAFWDTSALVPLCVQQQPSPAVRRLLEQHEIAVWWGTPVEMRSAFERLLRTDQLTAPEHATAGTRLENFDADGGSCSRVKHCESRQRAS